MHAFLIFTLLVGREVADAGALVASDETKHNFKGDENGNDDTNDYQCDFHATLLLALYLEMAVLPPPTPWARKVPRL